MTILILLAACHLMSQLANYKIICFNLRITNRLTTSINYELLRIHISAKFQTEILCTLAIPENFR